MSSSHRAKPRAPTPAPELAPRSFAWWHRPPCPRPFASRPLVSRYLFAASLGSLALARVHTAYAQEPDIPVSSGEEPAAPAPSEEASFEPSESPSSSAPRTAGLQLGAGFRYGVTLDDAVVDPWQTGLGLNLGYTTESALYLGGVFDYFFGESKEVLGTEASANVWQIAAELGYDAELGERMILRPKVGLGASTINVKCQDCVDDGSNTYVGVSPGFTAMFFFSRVTLSFDGRYQLVFANPDRVNALLVSGGIGF